MVLFIVQQNKIPVNIIATVISFDAAHNVSFPHKKQSSVLVTGAVYLLRSWRCAACCFLQLFI